MAVKHYFGYICRNGHVYPVKWEEVNNIPTGGTVPYVERFEVSALDYLNLALRDLQIKHPCKDLGTLQ